jgi:hypothetical protein
VNGAREAGRGQAGHPPASKGSQLSQLPPSARLHLLNLPKHPPKLGRGDIPDTCTEQEGGRSQNWVDDKVGLAGDNRITAVFCGRP